MNDQKADSLIKEFCNYLREYIPEFQELWEAQKALDNDPPSKRLWEDKEGKRQTVELMKNKGLPISDKQQQELSLTLKKMRENPVTMRYLKAKNFANKVSGKIGTQLQEIIGVDFAPRKGCK